MRISSYTYVILFLPLLFFCSKDPIQPETRNKKENENSEQPYMGQKSPGTTPTIFAPQLIPNAFGITFSPDGLECFFSDITNTNSIMTTKDSSGVWHKPVVALFSSSYIDFEPHITPDGKKLYFGSERPLDGIHPGYIQQWYVDKTDSGWSAPKPMDPPLRGLFMFYPSVANNGNMYFTRADDSGQWSQWIALSRHVAGRYQDPVKLSQDINSRENAAHPFIAPDESYLIFDARPEGHYFSDLYISFRNSDGTWAPSKNMSNIINTNGNEIAAFVSRDGKYLFFSRSVDGTRNLFWVNASIIETLK